MADRDQDSGDAIIAEEEDVFLGEEEERLGTRIRHLNKAIANIEIVGQGVFGDVRTGFSEQ
jgi:hypothetical protein